LVPPPPQLTADSTPTVGDAGGLAITVPKIHASRKHRPSEISVEAGKGLRSLARAQQDLRRPVWRGRRARRRPPRCRRKRRGLPVLRREVRCDRRSGSCQSLAFEGFL